MALAAATSHQRVSARSRWFVVSLLLVLSGCAAPPAAPVLEGATPIRPTTEATVTNDRSDAGAMRGPNKTDAPIESAGPETSSPALAAGVPGQAGAPVIERGLASWYGGQFHGRRTASGERYDKNALTAAHRTLPFGTRVRVRSVHSGREVVVRINDRGPFKRTRVIDLSQAAFSALGLKGRGVTQVELLPE